MGVFNVTTTELSAGNVAIEITYNGFTSGGAFLVTRHNQSGSGHQLRRLIDGRRPHTDAGDSSDHDRTFSSRSLMSTQPWWDRASPPVHSWTDRSSRRDAAVGDEITPFKKYSVFIPRLNTTFIGVERDPNMNQRRPKPGHDRREARKGQAARKAQDRNLTEDTLPPEPRPAFLNSPCNAHLNASI